MGKTIEPLVTVLVFTHNRPKELARFMKMMREQTYKNYEIRIIDESEEGYAIKYQDPPKVYRHVCHHYHDWGYKNRELIAGDARGEWVWTPNDDHIVTPDFLEKMMKAREDAPLVLCDFHHRTLGDVSAKAEPSRVDIGTFMVKTNTLLRYKFGKKDGLADGDFVIRVSKDNPVQILREQLVRCP